MEFSKRRRSIGDASDVPISVLDLPFSIVVDIFSRLPITTVLACKSVCKDWRTYISDPEFGNFYSKKSPYVSVLLFSPAGSTYSLLELKADYNDGLVPTAFRFVRNQPLFPDKFETLLGSCNGLPCFLHYSWDYGRQLSIWNPLTGECGLLPQPNEEIRVKTDSFLFGYSEKAKEYKVIRIFTEEGKCGKTETRVCTVGIDEDWRILNQDVPLPQGKKCWLETFSKLQFCEGTTFNGALHWMTEDLVRSDFLFSFDIGEEKVRPVPQPNGMFIRNGYTTLGVLRDCFCIFQISKPHQLDIWSMKEYGVSDSWTKETISFPIGMVERCYLGGQFKRCYPIVSWRGKGILMCSRRTLISYFPEEKSSTKVIARLDPRAYTPHPARGCAGYGVPYVPCFLSFKDLMKGFDGQLEFVKEKKTSQSVEELNHEISLRRSWTCLPRYSWRTPVRSHF